MALVLTPGTAGEIAKHSANFTADVRFAAPGANGSVLVSFASNTDLDFHNSAQNGFIEQWLIDRTKTATRFALPRGNLDGRVFDAGSGTVDTKFWGATPYQGTITPTQLPTLGVAQMTAWLTANPQSAEWLAFYDAYPNALFELYNAGGGSRQYNLWGYFRRAGGAWVLDFLTGDSGAAPNRGQRRTTLTTTIPIIQPTNWNGIYSAVRLEDTLCFVSNELIIPIVGKDAVTGFWAY